MSTTTPGAEVPWPLLLAGDLLVVAGLAILTLGLLGIWRFPDFYTRLHAAAKVGSLGLAAVLWGTVATGEVALVLRAALIAAFLVFTAPVTTHALARAAHRRGRAGAAEGGREGGDDQAGPDPEEQAGGAAGVGPASGGADEPASGRGGRGGEGASGAAGTSAL